MKTRREATRILAWAGLVPFVVLAAIAWTGSPIWMERLLVGYALLVLAFCAGGLWIVAVVRREAPATVLYISNGLVLAAVPVFVLPFAWACSVLALLFAVHWLSEWRWIGGDLPGWYTGMRVLLSVAVIALLVLAAILRFSGG